MSSNDIPTPTTLEEEMTLLHSKRKESMNTIRALEKELGVAAERLHAEEVTLMSDGQLSSTEKQRIETKKSSLKQAGRHLKLARRRWMQFALDKEDGLYMSMYEVVADLGAVKECVEQCEILMAGIPNSGKRRRLGAEYEEWLERLGRYGLDIRA